MTPEEKEELWNEFENYQTSLYDDSCNTIIPVEVLFDWFISKLEEKDKQIEKLTAFKEYVHKRLDDAGIENDPESPHKKNGCRIGGRLDIVLIEWAKQIAELEAAGDKLTNQLLDAEMKVRQLSTLPCSSCGLTDIITNGFCNCCGAKQ